MIMSRFVTHPDGKPLGLHQVASRFQGSCDVIFQLYLRISTLDLAPTHHQAITSSDPTQHTVREHRNTLTSTRTRQHQLMQKGNNPSERSTTGAIWTERLDAMLAQLANKHTISTLPFPISMDVQSRCVRSWRFTDHQQPYATHAYETYTPRQHIARQ